MPGLISASRLSRVAFCAAIAFLSFVVFVPNTIASFGARALAQDPAGDVADATGAQIGETVSQLAHLFMRCHDAELWVECRALRAELVIDPESGRQEVQVALDLTARASSVPNAESALSEWRESLLELPGVLRADQWDSPLLAQRREGKALAIDGLRVAFSGEHQVDAATLALAKSLRSDDAQMHLRIVASTGVVMLDELSIARTRPHPTSRPGATAYRAWSSDHTHCLNIANMISLLDLSGAAESVTAFDMHEVDDEDDFDSVNMYEYEFEFVWSEHGG